MRYQITIPIKSLSILILITLLSSVCLSSVAEKPDSTDESKSLENLELDFAKTVVYKEGTFSYSMVIKDGTISIRNKDSGAGLSGNASKKLSDEELRKITEAIRKSDFMNLNKKDGPENYKNANISISVMLDGKSKRLVFKNRQPTKIFNLMERISSIMNIPKYNRSPEEIREKGLKAFKDAEELFKNRKTEPDNLNKSIKQYDNAISYLRLFETKPPEFKASLKRRDEAKKLLKNLLSLHSEKAKMHIKNSEYEKALKEYKTSLALIEGNSDYTSRSIKLQVTTLETYLKRKSENK